MLETLRTLKQVALQLIRTRKPIRKTYELLADERIESLRNASRCVNRKCLLSFGYKVYSQSDEDGIIREIFNGIGVTSKTFVELGCGDGLENNTLALLFDGWRGLWIDAAAKSVRKVNTNFSHIISKGYLKVIGSFLTKDNVNDILSSALSYTDIDLLSIDLDGNDFHIFQAITCIKPRVVMVEYNAKFPPPMQFCMDYNESHVWQNDDCFGTSLKFLEVNLAKTGYHLVGCNLTGTNAFFVRKDIVSDKFLEPFSAENHYEPARYYLAGSPAGHPASYGALEKSLTMRVG